MSNANNYTISESYVLPSQGKIYDTPIDPHVTLRSMTTMEEMKRLSQTDTPYKVMSDLIESCLTTPLGMHVYDLCVGDYQFLLHKLRVVTYGPDYKMVISCPNCGESTVVNINLDDLTVLEYDEEEINKLRKVKLPQTGKEIELRIQTPRILDQNEARVREIKRKSPDLTYDPGLMVTLESLIYRVDGEIPNAAALETFVRKLPMRDANLLLQTARKLNGKVGLDTSVVAKCGSCGYNVVTTFRFTPEFFGPSID